MIKKILPPLLILLITISCGILSSDWTYAPMRAQEILSITDSVDHRQRIEFTVLSSFNNSCYEYGYMDIYMNETEINIGFAQKKLSNDDICLMVVESYEINESISITIPGQYNLHFWRTDSTSIDTVVTVY